MVALQKSAMAVMVLAGLSGALAGCQSKASNDTFGLSAARVSAGPSARNRQILIPEPAALKAIDSEQVVIRVSASEIQYLGASRWSDRLPRLVQSKLVEAFENTGKFGGVGKPGEGLAIDFQIVTDIRAFEVQTEGADIAVVEISAKVLNDRNGSVRAQKAFRATAPVAGTGNRAFIAALNTAFGVVTEDMVNWTLKSI